jgi:hypothetical protein
MAAQQPMPQSGLRTAIEVVLAPIVFLPALFDKCFAIEKRTCDKAPRDRSRQARAQISVGLQTRPYCRRAACPTHTEHLYRKAADALCNG